LILSKRLITGYTQENPIAIPHRISTVVVGRWAIVRWENGQASWAAVIKRSIVIAPAAWSTVSVVVERPAVVAGITTNVEARIATIGSWVTDHGSWITLAYGADRRMPESYIATMMGPAGRRILGLSE
jgi:hypothetical protein